MIQISPQLLKELKKDGELLTIWRCEKCFKKIPFYKTKNPLVNSIYLSFAGNEKYCPKCKMNMNKTDTKKKNNLCREIFLLRRYEGIIIEKEPEVPLEFLL